MDWVWFVCRRIDKYRRGNRFTRCFKTCTNNCIGFIKCLVVALLFDHGRDLFSRRICGEFANQTRNTRKIVYEATRASRNAGRIAKSVVAVSRRYSVQSG